MTEWHRKHFIRTSSCFLPLAGGFGKKMEESFKLLSTLFLSVGGTSSDNSDTHLYLYQFSLITCVPVWQSLASTPCVLTSDLRPGKTSSMLGSDMGVFECQKPCG